MDGSSSSSIFGLHIRARPMASICCSPPEKRTGGLVAALLQARQQIEHHVEVILDGLFAVAAGVRAHLQILLALSGR